MQTLLATFDDDATAQRAVDALMNEGFDRTHVHLQSGYRSETSGADGGNSDSDRGFMSSVANFFRNLFGADSDTYADNYSEAVRRGSSVVAVDARSDQELERARDLLRQLGSVDVDARADQWRQRGWTGFDPNSSPFSDDERDLERQSVPVVQEDIQVGKRAVDKGGVRVIKRVSETPVSQIVNLRDEHATIERRPVDRAATEADFANFKEGTMEIRETAEEAVVGKTARVVEEVVVGKEQTERSETVTDTVRRTDVEVEEIPAKRTTRDQQRMNR